MPREKFEATDHSVSAAYGSRQLVSVIFSHANYQNDDLREVCIRLHNTGIIDLLDLVHTKEFESTSLQEFFAGQRLYCDVLPKLEASVAAMMGCIKTLVGKAGNDLAANFPHEAFRKWCEGDLRRAREIISGARNDEDSAREFLTVALIAGNYDQDTKEFIRSYLDTRRLSGVFALGKIKHGSLSDATDALALLHETISDHTDDILYANVLSASFDIAKSSPQIDAELLLTIVRRICEHSCPAVLDACAQLLFHHQNELSHSLLDLLFNALKSLAVTQKGSLQTLDFALSQLLNGDHANEAIDFLKEYLSSNDEHLSLSDFKSFQSALKSNPAQLQRTLVSWMLTAEGVLCEGLATLFRNGEDGPFNFDVSVSHLDTTQQIFICRKVIGYLFTQPSIACSFLVCILRQCDDEVAETVAKLLFDPILRSYGGKAKTYLSSIPPDDKAFRRIKPALLRADDYRGEISSIGDIKELHPSESARQTVSLRDFDEMQDARKEAEKQSVLLSLVSRSVVLHGRRTLSYVQAQGQDREPMEMELHAHSFEFEMPRQAVLDPIGIDYLLRVFRVERLKS